MRVCLGKRQKCFLFVFITSFSHGVFVPAPLLLPLFYPSSFSPSLYSASMVFSHPLSLYLTLHWSLLPHLLSRPLFFPPRFFHSVLLSLSLFSLSFSLHLPPAKPSFSIPLSLLSYLSDRAPLCSSAALSLLIMSGTSAGAVNRDWVCVFELGRVAVCTTPWKITAL